MLLAFSLVIALPGCAPRATPAASPPGGEHVAAGPLLGRTGAYLTVSSAASRVSVAIGVLPGLLYRVSTPAGSGLAPRVTAAGGRIGVALLPTGADGPDEVRIVLNRDVRWGVRLPAGGGEQQLDLRRGRVTGVELGASGLVELRLPQPDGTVPVTLAGSVGSVVLSAAAPVRVELDEGAGVAAAPWASASGAGPGAVLRAPGWDVAGDRYAVRARSAVGSLTVRAQNE